MNSRPRYVLRRPRRGFTLIEAVVSIAVISALGSLAAVLIATGVDSYTRAAAAAQLHTELSIGLDRVDRELRQITRKTGVGAVAPNITDLTATSLTFNTNSTLTKTGSTITLALSGGTARVLLSDVTALSITAYDESNAAMAASLSGNGCNTIRRLAVSITVQRNGVSQTLRSKIFLRCTMAGAPTT